MEDKIIKALEDYKFEYAEKFKTKVIKFLNGVLGEDAAQKMWIKLNSPDAVEKFIEENNLKTFESTKEWLDNNKSHFDGTNTSIKDINAKNYPELPKYLYDHIEFLNNYSNVVVFMQTYAMEELMRIKGIDAMIIPFHLYIVYNYNKYKGQDILEYTGLNDAYKSLQGNNNYFSKLNLSLSLMFSKELETK